LSFDSTRLRAAALAAFTAVLLVSTVAPAPVAASTPADAVIRVAKAQLGDPWRYGAIGPDSFDCSGLVYYSFRQAGYLSKIGGTRMTAYGYYSYFRNRGQASTTGGRPGDLVVYGGGSHIGIYLGNGYVISTLTSGVRIHGLYAVTARFTAFLHTGMSTTTITTTTVATAVRYTTTYVNLRTGPSTAYSVIKVLPTGTRLAVLSSARDLSGRIWYKVQLSTGTIGWVAGWYTRT